MKRRKNKKIEEVVYISLVSLVMGAGLFLCKDIWKRRKKKMINVIHKNDQGVSVGYDKANEAIKDSVILKENYEAAMLAMAKSKSESMSAREANELRDRINAMSEEEISIVAECLSSQVLVMEIENRLRSACALKDQLRDIANRNL